jgi:hypothetical protein
VASDIGGSTTPDIAKDEELDNDNDTGSDVDISLGGEFDGTELEWVTLDTEGFD